MKKYILAWLAAFLVIFNLGYVFHEIIAFDFFAKHIGEIQRESYIIPYIAISFAIYTAIMVYLYKIFYAYYGARRHHLVIGASYGALIGFLWDALQGGLIEVATFKMPFIVFVVDSTYHTAEGALAGLIIAAMYHAFAKKKSATVIN